ncbi:baseplate protein [Photobacterium toruni]|uniref:Baseplate protein n=1 Tax=Photobacterium toruni TaxID=1935446 RepID=A0ABU6L8U4_9GAMM|nr:baseplate protein [Photobacterium toruni]
MSGHFNSRGDTSFLKQKFNMNMAAGEKLAGHEFEMSIDQYPDVNILIRSTQLAAMGRSDVEDFGPMGLKFTQHGALENSGEIAVTCAETITGRALSMVRDVIKNKRYIDINIRATPESLSGASPAALKQRLEHCKLRCDVVDLSTEDQAALVKPSLTIIYNWIDI